MCVSGGEGEGVVCVWGGGEADRQAGDQGVVSGLCVQTHTHKLCCDCAGSVQVHSTYEGVRSVPHKHTLTNLLHHHPSAPHRLPPTLPTQHAPCTPLLPAPPPPSPSLSLCSHSHSLTHTHLFRLPDELLSHLPGCQAVVEGPDVLDLRLLSQVLVRQTQLILLRGTRGKGVHQR